VFGTLGKQIYRCRGMKKSASLNTYIKIRELRVYREIYMLTHGKPPTLTHACKKIGISLRTVKRNAMELVENWKVRNVY
jgi:hypothetical protein